MAYSTLSLDIEDHIARLTLNRPEPRNAMGPAFWGDLRDAFAEIDGNVAARVVVISSTGPHFSSGLDIKALAPMLMPDAEGCGGRKGEQMRRLILQFQESFNVIERCRVPVLVAVQGGAIGGGVDMICACDMRYCSADAFFVVKEVALGITADVGTLQRLPHLIPSGMARELCYTARPLSADRAKEIGLVNEVYADRESMLADVMEIAAEIAAHSPLAMLGTKEMLNYTRDHTVADSLNYMATWQSGMLQSDDLPKAFAAAAEGTDALYDDLLPARALE
ncbi:MAG: crotonase/enoyl-CoA hydratase family protein [Alphaproteobacteria bacterium]